MDEQQPLWRTAWYWKLWGLYVFVPLNIVLAALATLTRTGHLSAHQFDVITTLVTSVFIVGFLMWANHQAQKRTTPNNS